MNKLLILLIILSSTPVLAIEDCKHNVVKLQSGDKAPCTGFLFSRSKEAEVRTKVMEHGVLTEQLKLEKKSKELHKEQAEYNKGIADKQKEQSELWREKAVEATEELVEVQEGRATRDWIFFAGGIAVTLGTVFAVGSLSPAALLLLL